MPKTVVLNQTGQKVADLTLSDYVFGIEPHQQVLYEVVNAQRAAMRQGTHDVKNRGEVSGGGRKPWRQKGTGRARQGSTRSPQWRHGGVVFGPTPRGYAVKLNQKVRQLGLRSALSYQVKNDQVKVIESLNLDSSKTKAFVTFLNDLGVADKKVLIVGKELTKEVLLASRNVPYVKLVDASHASVYDLLNCSALVVTKDAVATFEEVLGND